MNTRHCVHDYDHADYAVCLWVHSILKTINLNKLSSNLNLFQKKLFIFVYICVIIWTIDLYNNRLNDVDGSIDIIYNMSNKK